MTVRQLGLVGAVVMLVATLAWWPLDPLVLPDGAHVDAFDALRRQAAAFEVFTLGVLLLLPTHPRVILPAAVLLQGGLLFALTEALGRSTGGGQDVAGMQWLGDAWLGVVLFAILPLSVVPRVAAAVALAGAVVLGFFGVHPANFALPGATAQLSFGLFAVGFTVVAGEGTYRLTRRAFFERRALDRARAELEALSASLSDQVAERTEALRALTQHLSEAQESERRRLAHALHDDLGQQLTAMGYAVVRLAGRLEGDAAVRPLLEDLQALLDGTRQATRSVVTGLRPRILDDLGLAPALEWLVEDAAARSGVTCRVELPADDALPALGAEAELALFRVAQEGLTNALRHGRPGEVRVRLRVGEDVRLGVEDDGGGFDPQDAPGGFGLLGLRERLRAVGGSLHLDTAIGRGTQLEAVLPREAA